MELPGGLQQKSVGDRRGPADLRVLVRPMRVIRVHQRYSNRAAEYVLTPAVVGRRHGNVELVARGSLPRQATAHIPIQMLVRRGMAGIRRVYPVCVVRIRKE